MDISRLIPFPDPLPAPWGLLHFLLILTFILHLLVANIMLGGIAILWVNSLKKVRDPAGVERDRKLAAKLPFTIALAINFGVAPLLFLQVMYGQFIYVSSVLMAGYWISIFILIILAYYAIYLHNFKFEQLGRARSWVMGASCLLFLVVGYIFTNSLVLAINPGEWEQYFHNPAGGLLPSGDISLWPRFLHFVFASLALGGLAVALWEGRRSKRGDEQSAALVRQGFIWYGVATIVNFIIGALYLGTLPADVVMQVVFGQKLTGVIFLVGVAVSAASIPAAFAQQAKLTVICALVSVVFMVLFRFAVRTAYLAPYLEPDKLPISTQISPVVLFILALLICVGLVVYMFRLTWRIGKEHRA